MRLRTHVRALLTACVAIALSGPPSIHAQEARAVGPTPPRLSFLDGEVSYWRPGADDWVPAQLNTALAAGDSLYAADGGNVEVEVGTRAWVRAGGGTELGIDSVETGYLQLRVPAGHAAVDLKRLPEGQEIEVDTPNGAFLIEEAGYYRLDVDDQATNFVVRRGGHARVVPAGGDEIAVGSGELVTVNGTDNANVSRESAPNEDAWDRWNYDRSAKFDAEPRSAQYVSPNVAGVADLDTYGDWRDTPSYGHVWVPRDLPADWAPYSTGRWVWDGYYGWTWVDDAPWGWAPYHYGRWCNIDGYWGWAPGPVIARPVYSPALVAFFGGDHVGVSVGVGAPFVSWVALGYGEPVVPWWGPHGFVGRAYWGGWGGPRYVNHTVVNNTTIVNVNNITNYDNFRARNAVIGVRGDRFGRGQVEHVRIDADRVRDLRPLRGDIGVRPTRESLVARTGRGQRPPEQIQNRRVVATRAPQDPARLPRSAGLVQPNARRQPEPRIVSPTRGGGGERGNREERAGRNVPPPIRGVERSERGPNADEHGVGGRGHGANETERATGRTEDQHGPNDRGRGATFGERGGRDHAPEPPGRERGNASVERNDRQTRPETPAESRGHGRDQGAEDRGGNRRERGDVREPGREPTSRSFDRTQERDHGNHGGRDEAVHAPATRNEAPPPPRGGGEVDHGRSHERNDRSQREANQPERQAAPPPSFEQRGGGGGRDHGHNEQPREQPRMQQREQAPRMEAPPRHEPQSRQERPQVDRGGGREARESQRAPREMPQRQQMEAPHMQRGGGGGGDPRPDRGGGGGGGGNPRGGGDHGGAPDRGGRDQGGHDHGGRDHKDH